MRKPKERFDTSVCVGDIGCDENDINKCNSNGFSTAANKARCICDLGGKKCSRYGVQSNNNAPFIASNVCPPCPACNSCCSNPRIVTRSSGSKPLHQIWAESQGKTSVPTQQNLNQAYRTVVTTPPVYTTIPRPIYASNAGSYQVGGLGGNAFGQITQTPSLNCSSCKKHCCSPGCVGCGTPGDGTLDAGCASACGGKVR